jgi:dCMP deaminase
MEPCRVCTQLIISCGIKKVIAKKKYHAGQESRELLQQAGVELVVLLDEIVNYDNQI